jgi:phage tail sheath protein FI
MAETLISPGILLRENDLSQITEGPIVAGAALIGPTVGGPVNIPTVVTSYSEYKAVFGASFISGGTNYEYLTSMAALNYFEQGGDSLLVTRVASGSYTPATASVASSVGLTFSSATISLTPFVTTQGPITVVTSRGAATFNLSGSSAADIQNRVSASVLASLQADSSASLSSTNLVLTAKTIGASANTYYVVNGLNNTVTQYGGGTSTTSFVLETLTAGAVMNNYNSTDTISNGALPSGSSANIRWEVVSSNSGSGQFSLIIRRGDDNNTNQTVLETWNNLSMDPNQPNYVAYVIGDMSETMLTDEFGNAYLQVSGSYQNKSKYVRVKEVILNTANYFDQNGRIQNAYTGSIPALGFGNVYGSFGTGTGAIWGSYGQAPLNMFESIPSTESTYDQPTRNIQGVFPQDYTAAINLLQNADAYDFNIVYAPGLNNQNASSTVLSLTTLAQNRGDCIAVVDMTAYAQLLGTAAAEAASYDSSYAATYFPWLQVRSRETGKMNFVPPSTIIPAIYEYNDKVSAEWFAPAGLNRGNLATVLRPERRLGLTERNYLYNAKINPIAAFAGVGTVVYGQKTLQNKSTSLDRVNVRRLLISLKRYIRNVSETLVFEPNTQVTRNKFLNQVNPYLEYVQQRQGLYAFQVIMDDTNNTPDVIDRNQLVGAIYLQPTRVAEFIQLDFNILPTGASFGG